MADDVRDRITKLFQKNVANRVTRLLPFQTLLETTGRKSGQPRRIPLGGIDAAFDRETFETLNELMVEYGGMEKPLDIDAFVHEGAMREPGGAT